MVCLCWHGIRGKNVNGTNKICHKNSVSWTKLKYCIKRSSSSTRHIWDLNNSVFRLGSPLHDTLWCVCKYSRVKGTKSKSVLSKRSHLRWPFVLPEGLASYHGELLTGKALAFLMHMLFWICEWAVSQLWTETQKSAGWHPSEEQAGIPVQMGLRETNYFRPSGAGRAPGAGRQDCGLTSLLTAEFSHDLILTHSLEFSQSKPRLLAIGSCNKIPSNCIFKEKQLGV